MKDNSFTFILAGGRTDADGNIKFQLYFDGGTERKLQIKHLRKDLCVVHAQWEFATA